MGATDSKQKLGQRVIAARKKLENDMKTQSERVKDVETKAPETIKVIMKSITESFRTCSPFLESILLVAWQLKQEECSKIVLDTCKRIFTAPIVKEDYDWFIKYLFPSSVWMFKNESNRFMFEELIDAVNEMQKDIIGSMDSIYSHLQSHPKWAQVLSIKNQNIVQRQDHSKVGLLKELEMKAESDSKGSDNDFETFMDSNLAVNILTTTAKNINKEFQNHIKIVMSHYGECKAGPIKKVDRCVSKLENDYQNEAYPKSAKLLDLVRCSITFNTVDQLLTGYNGLIEHIGKNSGTVELARVKNGFLNANYLGGYRDIKVNVIYHSNIDPEMSMICEVQLLLGQYLHEKKRIHKLYSIVRQNDFFKMTVADEYGTEEKTIRKNIADLQFDPILNVGTQVTDATIGNNTVGKCSVDTNLGLVAVESWNKLSIIDIKTKKEIFSKGRAADCWQIQTHNWMVIDGQKFLAVQIGENSVHFFKVSAEDHSFVESKELEICAGLEINCVEFDESGEHIIMVHSRNTLEKRAVKNGKKVLTSIELKEQIHPECMKLLSLSNDGNWCAIAGGRDKPYFYLINIDKKVQHKITSTNLKTTRCLCFLNGDPNVCIVGGREGNFEVWDLKKRVLVKYIELETNDAVGCLTSSNNILAIGCSDKKLRLFDTNTWEMFWSQQYEMNPYSAHLNKDGKYFTIGGTDGEYCLVLEIK